MTDTILGALDYSPSAPGAPSLFTTVEPKIHGLVGSQYGDLEFDGGKAVRWAEHFCNDMFITDVNTGAQRYWVINWSATFPDAKHNVTGRNFFGDPAIWRKEQFAAGDNAFKYADEDWCFFIDAHEGLSFDIRSLPDDYNAEPFLSWIYREIQRAVDAGRTEVAVPFFVYLKYDSLQNVTYATQADQGGAALGIPPVQQAIGVPWYLPMNALVRLIKVSALRNPAYNWSKLDTPSTLAKPELAAPGSIHLNSNRGNFVLAVRTVLPTFNTMQFTIHCKLDQEPHGDIELCGFIAGTNYLKMLPDGTLQIVSWTAVGANTVLNGTAISTAVPIKVGVPIWLRGKLTFSTALCEYWYSYDGQTWTSIGATVGTNAGTLPYLSNSATLMIGAISQSVQTFPGEIYECYDTIDGVNRIRFVADQDLKNWTSGTSFTTTSGDAATIFGTMNAVTRPAFYPGGAAGNTIALNLNGVASTADPGPLPNEFVLVAEAGLAVLPPTPTYSGTFASQYHADAQRSWAWKRSANNGGVQFTAAPTGTSAAATTRSVNYFTTGTQGTTELCALSVIINNGSGNSVLQNWKSTDNGVTWVSASNPTTFPTIVPLDSNEILRIGGWSPYEIIQAPIYRVEARSGLDPKGGGTSQSVPGYITFPGAGNSMTAPDSALLRLTGDHTVVMRLRAVDWTPAVAGTIVAKNNAADPNRSYGINLNTNGGFTVFWSPNGTSASQVTATTVTPNGIPDNTWKWLAYTLDVDNGASGWTVRYWLSDDGLTWAQLGANVTGAGVTSIFAGSAALSIAALSNAGGSQPFIGDVGYVSIRDGIGAAGVVGGTEVFRYDAATDISPTISPTATSFISFSGQTMTILRSAGTPKTAIVPATAGLLWKCDAAEAAAGIPARTDKYLNVDSDGDGISNGWVVYGGTSVNNKSLSLVGGYQRIVGAPTALNMTYGVQQSTPYTTVVPGQSYAFEAIFKVSGATPRATANFLAYWYDSGNVQGAVVASPSYRVNSDGWVRALWYGIAPTTAATVRLIARINGAAGATGTEIVTMDVQRMSVIPMSWTIRGRLWSIHNPDVMLKAGDNPAPAAGTVVVPDYVTDVKAQVLSYAYAHWNIQDIPAGQTTVPALVESNDYGYQMRNLMSACRPIPGIPFGTPWQPPANDPPSLPGPWCIDSTVVTDPDLQTTVEESGHTPPDKATTGIRVPLYDHIMRINLRDGIWYEHGASGNIPLTWDTVNQTWVPTYDPDMWAEEGVDSDDLPPPDPSKVSLRLDGSAGTYAHTDDANYFDWSASEAFTLMGVISMNNWHPSSRSVLVSKWLPPNQCSWYWAVEAGGGMVLVVSQDGSTAMEYSLNLSQGAAFDLPGGTPIAVAVSFNTNLLTLNDETRFWMCPSFDLMTWEPVGPVLTKPNPTQSNLFASTTEVQVGAYGNVIGNAAGYYRVLSIRSGVAETTVGGEEVGILRGDTVVNPGYDRYGNLWINAGQGWSYTDMPGLP